MQVDVPSRAPIGCRSPMIDSRDIRDDLVHVLQHDLVGPFPIGPYQNEVLTKPPST